MTSALRRPEPRRRGTHSSPRAVTLAASIAWRHAGADPVRAVVLAQRVLPHRLRGCLRLAGPYGRAAVLWGAGDRIAALATLDAWPRRLAAFSLAVDQPAAAAAALARDDRARPVLAARLARSEGRLTEAIRALDSAPGMRARRLRTLLTAELFLLGGTTPPDPPGEGLAVPPNIPGPPGRAGCCTSSTTRCPARVPDTRSARTRSCWPSGPPDWIRTW